MSNCNKKILIDAFYPKEVRVVVLQNGQVIDFDQESKNKKQLKGNIYYAVVSRIEPSLQAVFIEYGISKHGFLPFSEISLDNYQISDDEKKILKSTTENVKVITPPEEKYTEDDKLLTDQSLKEKNILAASKPPKDENKNYESKSKNSFYKNIKVQDVISVGQSIVVQIIKEERGSKCATFSTYITLVGRYCVFMPNSGNKRTVSRRIEDIESRKKLKEILNSIELPEDSGVIIRTAGENKNAKEIEHDLLYLQSLLSNIKDSTKNIVNPTLLYIEGDIIKRTLRDLYDDNTEEIIISGSKACEVARECAKLIFQNKLRLRLYRRSIPIFLHYKIEEQIQQLYNNIVKLPSGGYIVINPTEALISIDVNSGRMTGEDSIEETAYRTNMEAAKEIARQTNLRGLSGLIVIDFIDMLKYRYCRAVESALKEAFKYDKAKVQFGHISAFGLMEVSRQRVKQSILDINTIECFHCKGSGRLIALKFIASSLLRELSYLANKNQYKYLILHITEILMTYIFNNERNVINDLEKEYGVIVNIKTENTISTKDFYIEVGTEVEKDSCNDEGVVNFFAKSYKSKRKYEIVKKLLNKATNSNFWLKKWFTKILNICN